MVSVSLLPNLKEDLVRVEKRLKEETVSELEFLTEIANHLIPAGGKRTRPGFTIAASFLGKKLGGEISPVSEDIITGAVAVELVHLGSLYHDDVMDSAETRRNTTSVNARYGEHNAILAGDFLLARASILAANLGVRVSKLLAETIAQLCAGQIIEHRDIYNLERTPEAYMKAIEGKTASLLSAACEIGAIVMEEDQSSELPGFSSQIGDFGRTYGMAFQIIDDISDLLTDAPDMGKPDGNDIAEGNFTLPIIYALEEDKTGELKGLLQRTPESIWENIAKARELASSSQGPRRAKEEAREFIKKAQEALLNLPKDITTQVFGEALEHLIGRLETLVK